MKKLFLAIKTVLLILGMSWLVMPAYAIAMSDPVALLQSIANKMIQELNANKATLKRNPQLVYSIANRLVVPHADLGEMAKRVLPPAVWLNATPDQRRRFEKEFTITLERTYASALAQYQDETVSFYPVRGGYQGKSSVTVDSIINRSQGPSIRVVYRMVLRGSEWKLYDMSVEGVSMLQSFRSQFADQLSRGNIEEVIKTLSAHNASPSNE